MVTLPLPVIASQIEAQIFQGCGASVDWTFRSGDAFTVSGSPEAVAAAADFLADHGVAFPEPGAWLVHDEELGESYAYLFKP